MPTGRAPGVDLTPAGPSEAGRYASARVARWRQQVQAEAGDGGALGRDRVQLGRRLRPREVERQRGEPGEDQQLQRVGAPYRRPPGSSQPSARSPSTYAATRASSSSARSRCRGWPTGRRRPAAGRGRSRPAPGPRSRSRSARSRRPARRASRLLGQASPWLASEGQGVSLGDVARAARPAAARSRSAQVGVEDAGDQGVLPDALVAEHRQHLHRQPAVEVGARSSMSWPRRRQQLATPRAAGEPAEQVRGPGVAARSHVAGPRRAPPRARSSGQRRRGRRRRARGACESPSGSRSGQVGAVDAAPRCATGRPRPPSRGAPAARTAKNGRRAHDCTCFTNSRNGARAPPTSAVPLTQ